MVLTRLFDDESKILLVEVLQQYLDDFVIEHMVITHLQQEEVQVHYMKKHLYEMAEWITFFHPPYQICS